MASLHAPRRTRRWVLPRLPSQAGLTIVETMVAMMLLLVGVLGTVSLIDVSNTSAANSRARDGATNLARELLEDAHDTSYSQVAASSTWLNPTLQGLSGGSGSVTNPDSHSAQTSVSRRGYSYTAAVSWCAVDDSKDGYGPADMKFSVNGGEVASGVTNNGNGTWAYNWQIAGLVDGTYTIGATSIDALGNRGQQITLQVRLARGAPLTAQHLVGGYNYVNPTGVGNGGWQLVELAWDANPEGSVTGYEVDRGIWTVCGGQTSLTANCVDIFAPSSG